MVETLESRQLLAVVFSDTFASTTFNSTNWAAVSGAAQGVFVDTTGQLGSGANLNHIEFDSRGNLYATPSGFRSAQRFSRRYNSSGASTGVFSHPSLIFPGGIDADASGNVYIVNSAAVGVGDRIFKFNSSGGLLGMFSIPQVNNTPVADAGGPYSITEGQSLTLSAAGSSDADSDPLSYRWDVDGDTDYDENVTGVNPTLTWTQLTNLGIDTGFNVPATIVTGGTVNLSATATDPAGAATIAIDGTGGAGTTQNTGVLVLNANSAIRSSTGDIDVVGQGGSGSGGLNTGIVLGSGGAVQSLGGGANAATITVAGTGGAGGNANRGINFIANPTAVTSIDGAIRITGAGGPSATDFNQGIFFNGGTVASTGIAPVSTSGTAGLPGVQVNGTVRSDAGTVEGVSEDTLRMGPNGLIESTAGTVTLIADNSPGNNGGAAFMVDGALVDAGSGNIDVTADGDVTIGGLLTITTVDGLAGVSNSGPGAVRFAADDMNVLQPVSATTGNIDLFSSNATRTIGLGSAGAVKMSGFDGTNAAFKLTDAELDLLTTAGSRRMFGNGSSDDLFNIHYGGSDTQPLTVLGFGGEDQFFVAPSPTMPLNLDGGTPSAPATPGDTLHLDMSAASPIVIVDTIGGGVKLRVDDLTNRTSTTFPQHFGLVGGVQMLQQLLVFAQGGNDFVRVAGHVRDVNGDPIPVEFHGEAGNDYLAGGGADDVLVGGPGRDRVLGGEGDNRLFGDGDDFATNGSLVELSTDGDDYLAARSGNDSLWGGGGNDRLYGAAGDADNDLIVAGTTDQDNANDAALLSILTAWSPSSTNDLTNIAGDGLRDDLSGGLGADEFWAEILPAPPTDLVRDAGASDSVNNEA